MTMARAYLVLCLMVAAPRCAAQDDAAVDEALAIADRVTGDLQGDSLLHMDTMEEPQQSTDAQVAADAKNARAAAKMAKQAAKVANKVATHSVEMASHAKAALKSAHDALNRARVESEGLSSEQKHSLREAEKRLKEATKAANYGEVQGVKAKDKKLQKLEKKLKAAKKTKEDSSELEQMRKEIEDLRKQLRAKSDCIDDEALKELQNQIEEIERNETKEDKTTAQSHDEMKAEIERLRQQIDECEEQEEDVSTPMPAKDSANEAVRINENTLDIDTAMPYGELEPFGREDTAQELTEDSIRESDEMVDQLERAEVAEEKRAVFRALTRLRGAAITSFDGVARSQTGNIDEYNKMHQWRNSHPLHHLADEESDVSKWAFPDNAD